MDGALLLLGLHRHLSAYSASPATAALGSLEFAGRVYEMAWRLRGSGVSSIKRAHAISIEAEIRPFELERTILPTLENLGWVKINRLPDDSIGSIDDVIPPPEGLIAAANRVLDITMPSSVERAALKILRATTGQPRAARIPAPKRRLSAWAAHTSDKA